jgi:hypothetical protein
MSATKTNVKVKLVGTDGNAFALLGKVRSALRAGGVPPEEVAQFTKEAMAGDYDNLLRVCMEWVEVL